MRAWGRWRGISTQRLVLGAIGALALLGLTPICQRISWPVVLAWRLSDTMADFSHLPQEDTIARRRTKRPVGGTSFARSCERVALGSDAFLGAVQKQGTRVGGILPTSFEGIGSKYEEYPRLACGSLDSLPPCEECAHAQLGRA